MLRENLKYLSHFCSVAFYGPHLHKKEPLVLYKWPDSTADQSCLIQWPLCPELKFFWRLRVFKILNECLLVEIFFFISEPYIGPFWHFHSFSYPIFPNKAAPFISISLYNAEEFQMWHGKEPPTDTLESETSCHQNKVYS